MKLRQVLLKNFRNFLDSGEVEIQPDVTCLVGKNESGKTAFLQGLCRLHPARRNVKFSVPDHYPAWLEKRDRLDGKNLETFVPIRAVFEWERADLEAVETKFGPNVLLSEALVVEKNYKNELRLELKLDEAAAVGNLLAFIKFPAGYALPPGTIKTFRELDAFVSELAKDEQYGMVVEMISASVKSLLKDEEFNDAITILIEDRMPQFFYFHEYSKLPYSVKIRDLLETDAGKLNDEQLTARALLKLAAAEDDYLLNPDYERRKRELENVANALTEDVLQFWTQNPELRVSPDITQKTVGESGGQQAVLDELKIRIWDQRHSLSLPFNEHSSGFQWFFSFLAAFSEYERRTPPVIILLDEPALGLHARAQSDFLKFIDQRLAASCQVIYTTHSPFMIQPGRLDRVRMVEDKGRHIGAKISNQILSTDRDTLFPLQGALGYDLLRHLFLAPNNLIVEGTSDYTYMRVVSDFLKSSRVSLDERWSLVPVGGANLIPTFVALMGHQLEVTVIADSRNGGHQRLNKLAADGILNDQKIITVSSITGSPEADLEDLFEPAEYLMLFNKAFGKTVKSSDLPGTGPIVAKLSRHLGVDKFDRALPADVFLRERDVILPLLSYETLARFESLFAKANATLAK
jgi:predicted ATP-dependent endonuclease of OLD family